jgi:hypothetical protein
VVTVSVDGKHRFSKMFRMRILDPSCDTGTWRAGIVAAVQTKLDKAAYAGRELDLLIYARGCAFDLIDFEFSEIAHPALASIGRENWGRTFSNIYVVDDKCFASASSGADHRSKP